MRPVADWLGDADRIAELGCRLRDASVPADRLALFRRTLHPEILCRVTAWAPERPVEIFDRAHGLDLSTRFATSPLDLAMRDGQTWRLEREEFERSPWRWADPLRGLSLSELLIKPLNPNAALVIGTRRAGGLATEERSLFDRLASDHRPRR